MPGPTRVQLRFFGLPPLQSLCHWFPSMNIWIRILNVLAAETGGRMFDPLHTWNLQEKGAPFWRKKQDKTTSNCQIVRYPLSVFGECITGKGIAFGVVLTCLRFFQVVCTTQLSFFPPKKHHQLPQQLPTTLPSQ